MSGYAVKKDGTGWRTVDGPTADPDNPSKIFPDDKFEYYSESLPEPPAPSAEQLVSMAVAQRDSLLSFAALRIAPLQDAVDLDSATDVEAARLKSWKKYRVAVNRVDVSLNPPPWPELPED